MSLDEPDHAGANIFAWDIGRFLASVFSPQLNEALVGFISRTVVASTRLVCMNSMFPEMTAACAEDVLHKEKDSSQSKAI
jgi:hypothetical protein